jgi:transposase-like protein
MRKSRFTEAQIVAILRELDASVAATELARKHGIHANTIRQWKHSCICVVLAEGPPVGERAAEPRAEAACVIAAWVLA